ncbi:MAG: DUF1440 domain-containing protein [Geobacteraceae bacterium GWC2_48_7]|nr:MAG: DUF1440 domain-containing protein [Geobacteraceae bacterium GWC2_48_7]
MPGYSSGESTKCSSLVTAAVAGLIATAVTGASDRLLNHLVSEEQKNRDRKVRKGTAHEIAGPYFAQKVIGKELGERGKKRAGTIFSITYSFMWGLIYDGLRQKYPQVSRAAGIPFAIPFFFACDGVLAPLLGISPNLRRVPWQLSAKEMANHVVWTATAEMVHRAVDRSKYQKLS